MTILVISVEFDLLGNGFPAAVAETHLDGALGADGVAAVKDDGLLSVQTNGARFLLVELFTLHLQAAQLRLNPLHFILLLRNKRRTVPVMTRSSSPKRDL